MTENISMDFLPPDHLADFRKSGISNEIILEAGIKSIPRLVMNARSI